LEIDLSLEGHLPRFSAIQTHLSRRFYLAVEFPGLRQSGSSSQINNQAQDFSGCCLAETPSPKAGTPAGDGRGAADASVFPDITPTTATGMDRP